MAAMTWRGVPKVWDALWRPVLGVAFAAIAVWVALLLWWLGPTWAVPAPFVVAVLAHGLIFWWRGDRAIAVHADAHTLAWTDRRTDRAHAVDLNAVHALTLLHYPAPPGVPDEVRVVLHGEEDALAALRTQVPSDQLAGMPLLPGRLLDATVGARAGLRAHAALLASCRQTVDDRRGTLATWLVAHVPRAALDHVAARVWVGTAPPLDVFGTHTDAPDGLLSMDAHTWRTRIDGQETRSVLAWRDAYWSSRPVELARAGRSDDATPAAAITTDALSLPLLVLVFDGDLHLALPFPGAPEDRTDRPVTATAHHSHTTEGAALLWHALRHTDPATWPALFETPTFASLTEALRRDA